MLGKYMMSLSIAYDSMAVVLIKVASSRYTTILICHDICCHSWHSWGSSVGISSAGSLILCLFILSL